MLFDHFGCHFRKRVREVLESNRFYKGFRNAFLAFEKPCFPLVYKVSRRFENALRKPSLGNAFDHFDGNFRKGGSKVFIFDRFIRVSATRFCILRNRVFHWFYKVFRRSENALRKPSLGNAFLIILGAIFEKGAPKSSFPTGFIIVFATRFCILRNRVFHWVYKVFRRSENTLRKPSLGNAF